MTASAVVHAEGLAARRALRNARIRGVAFAALGLLAFNAALGTLDTKAAFSFWIDKQGGESALLETSVGQIGRASCRERV